VTLGTQTIKRILLTGGGTAGHVNPALAIGSVLAAPETRFLFVGVRGRVEEKVVPREGIPIKYVRASGHPSGISFELVRFSANLLVGIIQSILILLRFRPQIIIGTGGYVSAPVIMAASFLRKIRLSNTRVVLHEQNAVPGKLNRLMGRFAHQVLVTFPETTGYFPENGIPVGYPLRKRIAKVSREEARRKIDLEIPEGRKVILIFGGSQGSRTINRALVDALGNLIPYRHELFLLHGTGLLRSRDYDAVKDTEERLHRLYSETQLRQIEEFYLYRDFFYDIELLYALSDLVVARGGAGSLSEISSMGLPALIIPKSNLSGDHQVMNARSMERAGGAEILYEQIAPLNGRLSEWIDGNRLAERILTLIRDDACLRDMRHHSDSFLNRDALARIERILKGNGGKTEGDFNGYGPAPAKGNGPLPGNRSLLAMLEKAYKEYTIAYDPNHAVSSSEDLEYFKNRASALLIHPSWQERNIGVKLLGLLKAREKIPALLALFNDRRPAARLKRLFGGDFEQVGFIRRNVITALIRIDEVSPEVEAALLTGLEDPYYEVRSESARAAAYFSGRLSFPEKLISGLQALLSDRIIDVSAAAAEALGKLGSKSDALPALLGMWNTRYWKLRAAVLHGILHLVERGEAPDLDLIATQAQKFILTSTDFKPQFEIKSAYQQLMESVSRKKQKRNAQ
jgi:UDP-N-acetylglucosamine--N-acetylmuramyl-(pentapeptide) pyrophosphoryl-undecaprenol N-acetylglucosamine transferase